ncbi:MAG: transglycosylase SLT domain-containing protein [Treponema sp.]|uniref:Transglycosylase SLT domain-containing protein n=1 Tax=Treponema vincentii TaxID=69710 RepID=A0A6P1Y018_9SPIR|nr:MULTISPECIES: lytic transglycosylase domain-containing protein [Treponema]QHX43087.1 transglycosylase SLT domain-containing protein [Treponema vincentii]UTC54146.1 transglycosylase SLT domain-containing protein [Treponema sp. OMZ 803]UTC56544.1 transglycosylase SLT domain-containing protein [Treponema sp. OMZ 906]
MSIHFTDKKPQIKYFCVGIIAGALYIHPIYANIQSKPPVSDTELYVNKQLLKNFQSNTFLHSTLIPHDHPLIEKFRKQYMSTDGYNYLSKIMKRSAPYRDFIIELLETENMPAELLFLPVIESGFFETATSKSGAVGIWQFMKNSIGGYNIHIDDWVDERRDPWKASIAAVKKLKWNYSQFNDWPLALAAYNSGAGTIRTAIKKAGKADYWYLAEHGYLKKETLYYVPKFLAIAEILSRSEELNIDWGNTEDHPPTSTIEIKRAIDVRLLAEELGLDSETIRKLNPSLRYFITPPSIKYQLRLPSAYTEAAQTVLNQSDKLLIKYYQYRIKSGDTLYALANHYGVSIQSILNYNTGLKPETLKIGKTILIPALKSVGTYSGKNIVQAGNFDGTHTIRQGDTLWSLALKYSVSVELLAQKNNLSVNSVLKLGNTLKVPIL